MDIARYIVITLQEREGWNSYQLSSNSGIPQSTIHRFIKGVHGEVRYSTLKKLADVFGLTVSQLQGEEPIPGLPIDEKAVRDKLAELAPKKPAPPSRTTIISKQEEATMLALMGTMGPENRRALLKIGSILAQLQLERRRRDEQRQMDTAPNPGRRRGEVFYNPVARSQYRSTDNKAKKEKAG